MQRVSRPATSRAASYNAFRRSSAGATTAAGCWVTGRRPTARLLCRWLGSMASALLRRAPLSRSLALERRVPCSWLGASTAGGATGSASLATAVTSAAPRRFRLLVSTTRQRSPQGWSEYAPYGLVERLLAGGTTPTAI